MGVFVITPDWRQLPELSELYMFQFLPKALCYRFWLVHLNELL